MPTEINHSANPTTSANKSVRLGPWIARYSLALVFVWFAGLVPSATGGFLLKDVGLLGLSLWLFIDAVAGLRHHATGTNPAL
jgi:hypothetical protein